MATSSSALISALLSVYLATYGCALEIESTWKGSEDDLYKSVYWEPNFGNLIMVQEGAASQGKHDTLKEQMVDSGTFFIEVTCGDSHGEVCSLLSENTYAVRSDESGGNKLTGVKIPEEYQKQELSYLLQVLLGDKLTTLTTYAELKALISQQENQNLFIVYVANTTSQEYLELLMAWVQYGLPLYLTNQLNTLPLQHRPKYSFTAKPLYLWSISLGGKQWLMLNYSPSKNEEEEESFKDKLLNFVDRLQFPIVVNYYDGLEAELEGRFYHMVYMFSGLGGGIDVSSLAEKVAKVSYTDFIFVVGKRDTDLAQRLLVTADKRNPQIVIQTYAQEDNLINLEIESNDMNREVEQLWGVLESVAHENPRTGEPENSHTPPIVSVIDKEFFRGIVEGPREDHVLTAFCKTGHQDCPGFSYDALVDTMAAIQMFSVKDQLGSLIAHVVECDSVADVELYGFNTLPAYGLYNNTKSKWYKMNKELTKPYQAMALVVLATGLDELLSVDLTPNAFEDDSDYTPFLYDEIIPSPQTEDDHFALLLKTLPTATFPESSLTSDNFDDHVSQFEKTVVVFYMSWCSRSQLFLNHVVAAYEKLDKDQNVSLAVVSCSDWTDLCTRVGVTTYPTALLFTPHTIHTPTPLTHLDTPHILNALGQYPLEEDDEDQLLELTPHTLPRLLGGDITTSLVVWCDSQVTSGPVEGFKQLAQKSKGQHTVSFAWMDSSKYAELLTRIAQIEATFPAVLVFQLSKHEVYQFPVTEGQSPDEIKKGLETFLKAVADGEISPTATLPNKTWEPIQPPVLFPSEEEDYGESEQEQIEDHTGNGDAPMINEQSNQPPPTQHSHSEL